MWTLASFRSKWWSLVPILFTKFYTGSTAPETSSPTCCEHRSPRGVERRGWPGAWMGTGPWGGHFEELTGHRALEGDFSKVAKL